MEMTYSVTVGSNFDGSAEGGVGGSVFSVGSSSDIILVDVLVLVLVVIVVDSVVLLFLNGGSILLVILLVLFILGVVTIISTVQNLKPEGLTQPIGQRGRRVRLAPSAQRQRGTWQPTFGDRSRPPSSPREIEHGK